MFRQIATDVDEHFKIITQALNIYISPDGSLDCDESHEGHEAESKQSLDHLP